MRRPSPFPPAPFVDTQVRVFVQAVEADTVDVSTTVSTDTVLGRTRVAFVGSGYTIECRDWRAQVPQVGDEFTFVLSERVS